MASPKPKPTKLKILEGNPGKRPLNLNEPKPKQVVPKCPDWLMDDARKHENIIYGWQNKHKFFGGFKTSVIEFAKPLKSDLHPTMKPIGLLCNLIEDSTLVNNIIIDLFGGSGSTLIACEKLKRKCYMMEIDPHYCDVIVKRWEDYTGKKAELI